jgi:predicted Fe-S protein YdhL (DUF1289 family)
VIQPHRSPCVRNCTLDDDDVCIGCERTLAEILAWSTMTDPASAELMAELSARRDRRVGQLQGRHPEHREEHGQDDHDNE